MSRVIYPPLHGISQQGREAGNPTFSAIGLAYAAYANPTDLIGLRGAAGKVLSVLRLGMLIRSTAATKVSYTYYKRTSLNTGGSPTTIASAGYDSRQAAASGVFRSYGAAPTIVDAAANPLFITEIVSAVLTGTAVSVGLNNLIINPPQAIANEMGDPLTLLENEELVMNFGGAALPTGFTAFVYAQWGESNLP